VDLATTRVAVVAGGIVIQTQPVRKKRRTLFVFSQHQISAAAATAVDFAVMIVCKSGLGLTPFKATAIGSLFGAFISFTLGRRWVFQSVAGDIRGQALRYAFVSTLSLIFNAVGEKLIVQVLGMNYIFARVVLSVVVGMIWNFPMHRYFVFRDRSSRDDFVAAALVSDAAPPQTAPHQTS
jgi:putative flippase GtrA